MTATLARTPGTSLHRQLFTVLREQIIRGQYQVGGLIPKEEELCNQFGVSRITVRRALADLEAEGLVEKRQGRGTYVSQELPPARPMATLNFIDAMRQVSDETSVEVLKLEQQKARGEIAQFLALDADTPLLHVLRLRRKGEIPVMITEAWVPYALLGEISEKSLETHALFELLIQNGVKFERVVQEFTAVAATPDQARLLKVPVGQPLIRVSRLIYDEQQNPVQHLVVVMSPERSRLLMNFSVDAMNTLAAGSIFHDI